MLMETTQSAESLRLRRLFRARRERVFRAWTDPAALQAWWAPPGVRCLAASVDLRPGGQYRIRMAPIAGGADFAVGGRFIEVQEPERLVYTWRWEADPEFPETVVTVEFVARNDATELILTHDRLPSAESVGQHVAGWTGCLESFAAYLQA